MSKDQVWKIISFFHNNRPKNFFPYFSRLRWNLEQLESPSIGKVRGATFKILR